MASYNDQKMRERLEANINNKDREERAKRVNANEKTKREKKKKREELGDVSADSYTGRKNTNTQQLDNYNKRKEERDEEIRIKSENKAKELKAQSVNGKNEYSSSYDSNRGMTENEINEFNSNKGMNPLLVPLKQKREQQIATESANYNVAKQDQTYATFINEIASGDDARVTNALNNWDNVYNYYSDQLRGLREKAGAGGVGQLSADDNELRKRLNYILTDLEQYRPTGESSFDEIGRQLATMSGVTNILAGGVNLANQVVNTTLGIEGEYTDDFTLMTMRNQYYNQNASQGVYNRLLESSGDENVAKIGQTIFDAGVSSIENIERAVVFGPAAGLYLMGVGVAGQEVVNLKQQYPDMSNQEVLARSIKSGAVEIITEQINDYIVGGMSNALGIDGKALSTGKYGTLSRIAKALEGGTYRTGKQLLAEIGKSSFEEGIEEVESYVLNNVIDQMVFGDDVQWSMTEALDSFIGGALSGAMMSGPSTLIGNSKFKKYALSIKDNKVAQDMFSNSLGVQIATHTDEQWVKEFGACIDVLQDKLGDDFYKLSTPQLMDKLGEYKEDVFKDIKKIELSQEEIELSKNLVSTDGITAETSKQQVKDRLDFDSKKYGIDPNLTKAAKSFVDKYGINIAFDDTISGNGLTKSDGTIVVNPNSDVALSRVLFNHESMHTIADTVGYQKMFEALRNEVKYAKVYNEKTGQLEDVKWTDLEKFYKKKYYRFIFDEVTEREMKKGKNQNEAHRVAETEANKYIKAHLVEETVANTMMQSNIMNSRFINKLTGGDETKLGKLKNSFADMSESLNLYMQGKSGLDQEIKKGRKAIEEAYEQYSKGEFRKNAKTKTDDNKYAIKISNNELANGDGTAIFIKNTDNANYIDMIFNGDKTEETRSTRSLDEFIGKPYEVTDGKYVYGTVTFGEPRWISSDEFHNEENQQKHRVPVGDKYDSNNKGKWSYPIESYERYESPKKLSNDKNYNYSYQARETRYDVNTSDSELSDYNEESSMDYEARYSIKVTDKDLINKLNSEPVIITYRTMQLIDGGLYSPMNADENRQEGKTYKRGDKSKLGFRSELGEWEQSTEAPEKAILDRFDKKTGRNVYKYKLNAGEYGTSKNRITPADYNPYMHSSNLVINDQFTAAYDRPNLVVVKCAVPVSESDGAYWAEKATDPTGWKGWKKGIVATKIAKQKPEFNRQVFLSRYLKPLEIVPDSEVAKMYKEYLDGTDVAIPYNVVTPNLLNELKKIGVKISESASSPTVEKSIVKKSLNSEIENGETRYSIPDVDSHGRKLSKGQQNFFKDSKAIDENGNLVVVYHGSNDFGFTVFDGKFSDDNRSLFFTSSKGMANTYVGDENKIYKLYLNLKNPYIVDANHRNWNNIKTNSSNDELINKFDEFVWYMREYDENINKSTIYESFGNLEESIDYINNETIEETGKPIWNEEETNKIKELGREIDATYRNWNEEDHLDDDGDGMSFESYLEENEVQHYNTRQLSNYAYKNGYDGVIIKNVRDNGSFSHKIGSVYESDVYIAFDSNQVKSVDNENPTSSPDIRYSIDTDGVTTAEDQMGRMVFQKDSNGDERYSYSTYWESGRNELIKSADQQVKDGVITREEADRIIREMDKATKLSYKLMNSPDYDFFRKWSINPVARDQFGEPMLSWVKPNAEYPANLDASYVCKKRSTYDRIMNKMVKMGIVESLKLNRLALLDINNIIRKYGLESACGVCYVEAKRYNQTEFTDRFVKMYNEIVESLDPNKKYQRNQFNFGENQEITSVENGIETAKDEDLDFTYVDSLINSGKNTVPVLIARLLKENAKDRKLVTRGDFMATDGFDTALKNNPEVLTLYNRKKGTAGPKKIHGETQYLHEVLSDPNFNPDKLFKIGGGRLQSFSDYVAHLFTDYAEVISDFAMKKAPLQTYTKEMLMVMQFGKTKGKVNMSAIPDYAEDGVDFGLDKDGKLIWRDGQSIGSTVNQCTEEYLKLCYKVIGIDYDSLETKPTRMNANEGLELAFKVQDTDGYTGNCGVIAIGVSDKQIRLMMDDARFKQIIPYHRSGINHILANELRVGQFKNYEEYQNTMMLKSGEKCEDDKQWKLKTKGNWVKASDKAEPNFNELLIKNKDADFPPRAAADEYIQWCRDNGYRPKFYQFINNEDGTPNANYYKVLTDFCLTDRDGNYCPQESVEFNLPENNSAFGSIEDLVKMALGEEKNIRDLEDDVTPSIIQDVIKKYSKERHSVTLNGQPILEYGINDIDAQFNAYLRTIGTVKKKKKEEEKVAKPVDEFKQVDPLQVQQTEEVQPQETVEQPVVEETNVEETKPEQVEVVVNEDGTITEEKPVNKMETLEDKALKEAMGTGEVSDATVREMKDEVNNELMTKFKNFTDMTFTGDRARDVERYVRDSLKKGNLETSLAKLIEGSRKSKSVGITRTIESMVKSLANDEHVSDDTMNKIIGEYVERQRHTRGVKLSIAEITENAEMLVSEAMFEIMEMANLYDETSDAMREFHKNNIAVDQFVTNVEAKASSMSEEEKASVYNEKTLDKVESQDERLQRAEAIKKEIEKIDNELVSIRKQAQSKNRPFNDEEIEMVLLLEDEKESLSKGLTNSIVDSVAKRETTTDQMYEAKAERVVNESTDIKDQEVKDGLVEDVVAKMKSEEANVKTVLNHTDSTKIDDESIEKGESAILKEATRNVSPKSLTDEEVNEIRLTDFDGSYQIGRELTKNDVAFIEHATIIGLNDKVSLNKTMDQNREVICGNDETAHTLWKASIQKPLREAKKTYMADLHKYFKRIGDIVKETGIKKGTEESAAVQWLGEGTRDWNETNRCIQELNSKGVSEERKAELRKTIESLKYTVEDVKRDFPNTWQNIVKCEKECRSIYDELWERENEALSRIYPNPEIETLDKINGLKDFIKTTRGKLKIEQKKLFPNNNLIERYNTQIKNKTNELESLEKDYESGAYLDGRRVPKRQDYFHHFQEIDRGAFASLRNIASNDFRISNKLAGQTEYTEPKSKWFGFMRQRKGGDYTADAIGGIERYIPNASYVINIDPYVAHMRGLICGLRNASGVNDNGLSNTIDFLVQYTNNLAGKSNTLDRAVFRTLIDRNSYQYLKWINARVKANVVMGNISSAISQFYNLPNAVALIQSPKAWKDGMALYVDYVKNQDGNARKIMNNSVFLAERYLDYLTPYGLNEDSKVKEVANFILTFGDEVVARQTWFAAYSQAVQLGKSEQECYEYADTMTNKAIAGRGIGEIPLNQQSEIIKLFAPFQVEVNNQWQLTKQLHSQMSTKGKRKDGFVGLLAMAVMTFLMNKIRQQIDGRETGVDLIDAFFDGMDGRDENDSEFKQGLGVVGRMAGEMVSNVPGATSLAPIVFGTSSEKIFGDADPTRYGTGNVGLNAIFKPLGQLFNGENVDIQESLLSILPSYGGKQLDRSISYLQDLGVLPELTVNANDLNWGNWKALDGNVSGGYSGDRLKYSLTNQVEGDDALLDVLDIAKGTLFGSSSTRGYEKYEANGFNRLTSDETDTYKKLYHAGMTTDDAYDTIRSLKSINGIKKNDGTNQSFTNSKQWKLKVEIESMDIPRNQKDILLDLYVTSKDVRKLTVAECKEKIRDAELKAKTNKK